MGNSGMYTYTATFVTEQEEIATMSVTSIDWVRDYRNASADEIMLTVMVPYGVLNHRILPFKENLRLTIERRAVSLSGVERPVDVVVQTFDAFIQHEDESAAMGTQREFANQEISDMSALKEVRVQLMETAFTILRTRMVGGVFRNCRPYDVLMTLINDASFSLDVDDEDAVRGIHSVEPSNNLARENIVIPHGMPLVSLADKLQSQHGGIYNSGIGCYYQKGEWYIWPLYDSTRFDEVEKKALFVIVPDNTLIGVEHTWRLQDETYLVVTVTGGTRKLDMSEMGLMNEGDGTRYVNAENLMGNFLDVKDGKASANRSKNAIEYSGVERRGPTMSRVSGDITTSNPFHEASKVVARSGAFITMNWENSNPDLVFPGMQCEVAFLVQGVPQYINGVVVFAHSFSALSGEGLHQRIHQVTTQVAVMVDRNSPEYTAFLSSQ